MAFQLDDIFPNLAHGLSNIGFFLGAGASQKAGFPMMPNLTIQVLKRLKPDEEPLLESLVQKSHGISIDKSKGEPNIEIISDIIEAYILSGDPKHADYPRMVDLRRSIRQHIVEVLLDVKNPKLDDHIRFFTALNKLFSGRSEQIWIFTPNYDLLFEIVSSLVRFPLINGFIGSSVRFFSINSLLLQNGSIEGHTFQPLAQPTIRLVKLHGSLDWWKHNGTIYSTEDSSLLQGNPDRVVVLPRKKKITETLDSPFDDLFRVSARILGTTCKYLVSCGYGFGDQHINETLLLPKLQQSKLTLTAFVKEDSANLNPFKNVPSFSFGTEVSSKKRNSPIDKTGSDLWQFEKLVDLLANSAGI